MARIWKVVAAVVGTATAIVAGILLWPRTVSKRRSARRTAESAVISLRGEARARRRSDSQLAAAVESALSAAFGDAAAVMTVKVDHEVVTLRGEVEHLTDIRRYDEVVRSVDGVRDVDNLLRLRVSSSGRPQVLTA